MSNKIQFNTKIGLIAATVGSAVGLGNIWRFPAVAQEGGGGAFLLVYVLCVLLLGVPVMSGEFAIGRAGGSDAATDFRRLSPGTKWWLVGWGGILTAFLIAIFYMVVAGWTLEYLFDTLSGSLFEGTTSATAAEDFGEKMNLYIAGSWNPVIFTLLVIAINAAVLLLGVQKGIERISNIMMPLLFVLLLVFCVVSLTLPGAGAGVDFFLSPDFSKITPGVIISALGQAFFSLSLGMGILITYSAYFPKKTNLCRTAVTVSMLDMLVAVLMGLVIFPALMSFGIKDASVEGTSLVYITMPMIFCKMPCPQLWSSLFFALLLLAALTSTISITEVPVRYCQDRFGMSRRKAVFVVVTPLLVLCTFCALSLGPLSDCTVFGLTMFDLLDKGTTNFMLPVIAFATCVYAGWFAPKGLVRGEFAGKGGVLSHFARIMMFILKWIAPILIGVVFIGQLFG